MLHHVAATAEPGTWEPPAHDLAQDGEVGGDREVALCPRIGQAEPRHDLVEDEKGLMRGAELPEALQETRLGRHDAHVGRDRLHDHGGNLAPAFGERRPGGGEVVVWHRERVPGRALRHAG